MSGVFEIPKVVRHQEWEGACADGKYAEARSIAEPRLSDLSLAEQLEAIKIASNNGLLLTSDVMRVRGILETRVLEGGTPLDQSIFTDIAFLDDLLEPEDV